MPFHVGGHKPKPPAKVFRFRFKHRLMVAGGGAALILSGLYKFGNGFSSA
jgi:hypothetical protein